MSTLLKTFITRTSSDLPRESSEMFISFRARAGGGVTPVYGLYIGMCGPKRVWL